MDKSDEAAVEKRWTVMVVNDPNEATRPSDLANEEQATRSMENSVYSPLICSTNCPIDC